MTGFTPMSTILIRGKYFYHLSAANSTCLPGYENNMISCHFRHVPVQMVSGKYLIAEMTDLCHNA